MPARANTIAENLKRLRKLTRENDLLLAKTLLQMEDLHGLNESLKTTLMQLSQHAGNNGNNPPAVNAPQATPRKSKRQ